jgi:hypothetical protein
VIRRARGAARTVPVALPVVLAVLLVVSTVTWALTKRALAAAEQGMRQQTTYTEARAALVRGDCAAAEPLLARAYTPDATTARYAEEDQATCRSYRSLGQQIRAGRRADDVLRGLLALLPAVDEVMASRIRTTARRLLARPGAVTARTCPHQDELVRARILRPGILDPLRTQVLATCWRLATGAPREQLRRRLLAEVTGPGPTTPLAAPGFSALPSAASDRAGPAPGTATLRVVNNSRAPQLLTLVGLSRVVQVRLRPCTGTCPPACEADGRGRASVTLVRGPYRALLQTVAEDTRTVPARGIWSVSPGRASICLLPAGG